MNGTDHFKRTIQAYLDSRAAEDKLFAASYYKPNKSIDECVTYILNWVQKSGCNGFTDGEIYSQAVHYYDEDDRGRQADAMPSCGEPCGGTDGRGKGGSKAESHPPIPRRGTAQDAEPEQG